MWGEIKVVFWETFIHKNFYHERRVLCTNKLSCCCLVAKFCLTNSFATVLWSVAIPGSSVHGIFLAGILEWVAIESSRPRDQTPVSCIAGGFFTTWVTREAPKGELILIKQYAIKRILLITFCQQIIKLGWNEQTVISKLLSVTHCVLMDTQSDWVRKTTYKDKGRPRRPIRVYLLIIQEADHFNFIHSLSDNINSKNGKMLQFLNVILIPKEENTRRKEDRGAFYSGIQMQKCSTKY